MRYCGVGVRFPGWLPGQLLNLAVPPPAKHHVLSDTSMARSIFDNAPSRRPVRGVKVTAAENGSGPRPALWIRGNGVSRG